MQPYPSCGGGLDEWPDFIIFGTMLQRHWDCLYIGRGEIPAWLTDAGSGNTHGYRFPSWRHCHGLYTYPFSSMGKPRVRFFGPDGGGTSRSFPFLRALSCLLEASLYLVFEMLDVALVRLASSVLGFMGLAVFFFCLGRASLVSAPGAMLMPLRSCHVLYLFCTQSAFSYQ